MRVQEPRGTGNAAGAAMAAILGLSPTSKKDGCTQSDYCTSRTLPRIQFHTTRLQTEIVSCMHLSEPVSLCHCDVITRRLSCMLVLASRAVFVKKIVGERSEPVVVRLTCDPSAPKGARLPAIFRHVDFDHRKQPVIGPVRRQWHGA